MNRIVSKGEFIWEVFYPSYELYLYEIEENIYVFSRVLLSSRDLTTRLSQDIHEFKGADVTSIKVCITEGCNTKSFRNMSKFIVPNESYFLLLKDLTDDGLLQLNQSDNDDFLSVLSDTAKIVPSDPALYTDMYDSFSYFECSDEQLSSFQDDVNNYLKNTLFDTINSVEVHEVQAKNEFATSYNRWNENKLRMGFDLRIFDADNEPIAVINQFDKISTTNVDFRRNDLVVMQHLDDMVYKFSRELPRLDQRKLIKSYVNEINVN